MTADSSGAIDTGGAVAQRNGAGAVQLSSYTKVRVEGLVNVAGTAGSAPVSTVMSQMHVIGGGGAGGSLLLEAPQVELAATANIETRGGDGGACTTTANSQCVAGGAGATAATTAANGSQVNGASPKMFQQAGGGGGGLGRLRINTATGQYTSATGAVIDAVVTMGSVGAQ